MFVRLNLRDYKTFGPLECAVGTLRWYMTVACQYAQCDWRMQHTTHLTVSAGISFTNIARAYDPLGP